MFKQYRQGVGIIIKNHQNKYFMGKRVYHKLEAWQLPQGGIEPGERPEQAMVREVYEETGIQNIRLLNQTKNWLKYDLPPEYIPLVWEGKYHGQQQQWFLVEFTGSDSEINLLSTNDPEFNQWQWATASEVIEKAVDFKKQLYQAVFKEFGII